MANIRTLKLNLLGDVSQFRKSMKTAGQDTQSFSGIVKGQMKSLAKSAAIAGAAIGSMAVAFGVDAVKAYAEDERGQRRLQVAIKNTTKATAKQRKGVEAFIAKTSLQYAVVDDKLRPAFQRLVQATKSLSKSQQLLPIVLDAAAASGKDVETVAAALSKAYGGNAQSLARLGLGIDKAILKTGDFNLIMKELTRITGGQAKAAANSFDGQMAKFKISMDEAKESVGGAILKGLQPMADKWLPKIASGVTTFVNTMTGQGNFNDAVKNGSVFAYDLAQKTLGFFNLLKRNKDTLETASKLIAAIFIGAKAGAAVSAMRSALTLLVGTFGRVTVAAGTAAGAEAAATGGASLWAAVPAITAIGTAFGIAKLLGVWDPKNKSNFNNEFNNYVAGGGSVTVQKYGPNDQPRYTTGTKTRVYNGITYQWDPVKKKWYVPDISGGRDYSVQPPSSGRRNFRQGNMSPSSFGGAPVIINLNGIVDAESARRSIQKVLNQSSIRTSPVAVNGSLI